MAGEIRIRTDDGRLRPAEARQITGDRVGSSGPDSAGMLDTIFEVWERRVNRLMDDLCIHGDDLEHVAQPPDGSSCGPFIGLMPHDVVDEVEADGGNAADDLAT